jgi:hypothetical protein
MQGRQVLWKYAAIAKKCNDGFLRINVKYHFWDMGVISNNNTNFMGVKKNANVRGN